MYGAVNIQNINTSSVNVEELLRVLMNPEQPEQPEPETQVVDILPLPQKGKYSKVREYIKERSRFDAEFKTFVNERSLRDLCTRLSKEFGWFVDEHSLGSNLNRHR